MLSKWKRKNKNLRNEWQKKMRNVNSMVMRVRRNWRGKIQTLGNRDATHVVRLTRPEYYRLRALIGKRKGDKRGQKK